MTGAEARERNLTVLCRTGPRALGYRQPLEASKGKEMNLLPQGLQKECSSADPLILGLLTYRIITEYTCTVLKPLNLW